MAGELARALMKSKSKSEMKRLTSKVESQEDLDSFGEAAKELFEHVKSGDFDAFQESLKAAIEIVKNEE